MSNDNWTTPRWFMRLVRNLYDRTPRDYLEDGGINALEGDWLEDSYLNPPYSNPLPFIKKAVEEHKKNKINVVFLLKLDPTTEWFKTLEREGAHFLFFCERLHYSEGGSAPFPSVLAILSD